MRLWPWTRFDPDDELWRDVEPDYAVAVDFYDEEMPGVYL